MIKAGIAGLGWWGQNLVNSVQNKSDVISFTAGAVRNPGKVDEFAGEKGLALFDSLDAMLANADIDAVVLATPHSTHADQMVAAAAAGKHIYSEKPFTMSKAEAERAIAAANDAGVQVVVGHNRRFHPAMTELRERVTAGALGTVLHVEATEGGPSAIGLKPDNWRSARSEWPAGGMTPMGIHLIDGMIDLFGPISSVFCQSVHRFVEADVDDATSALLQFESGVTGYIGIVLATRPQLRFAVHGTDAIATIRERSYNFFDVVPFEGEAENIDYGDYKMDGDALAAELEAFANAVEGRAPYPIPQDQIVHAVAVLEAIIESAESGAPVKVS